MFLKSATVLHDQLSCAEAATIQQTVKTLQCTEP